MARQKSIQQVFSNALTKARRAGLGTASSRSGRSGAASSSGSTASRRASSSPLSSVKKEIAGAIGGRASQGQSRGGRRSATSGRRAPAVGRSTSRSRRAA
jgi:hypothetical protein